jgi:glyoxylase-like metal-dependent hydrolase (beta-lactamase superfamily II)
MSRILRLFSSRTFLCLIAFTLAASNQSALADSSNNSTRTVTKLAEGVYEIRHPDAPDTFPQSNTLVVIGEKFMLVVDSCLLPSSAREDIEQIRKWTNKPVTYLVNTHWHFDHTLGNATYAAAFPGIQIVAQRATHKLVTSFNPGAMARYPGRAERFKKILDSGKLPDGTALTEVQRHDFEKAIGGLSAVVAEFKTTAQLPPNVVFDNELDIDLGNRPVQIKFLGPGNTAGDTVVYLPNEKIAAVGDLLDHPVPYFYGGIFPLEFPETLRAIGRLNVETIVPGHGEVLHGTAYVQLVTELITAVNREVEKELNESKTQEEIEAAVPKAI